MTRKTERKSKWFRELSFRHFREGEKIVTTLVSFYRHLLLDAATKTTHSLQFVKAIDLEIGRAHV